MAMWPLRGLVAGLACVMLFHAGSGRVARADNDLDYPRLSLGTGQLMPWVAIDSTAFLLRFQEVFGRIPPTQVDQLKAWMATHGDSAWVSRTRFIYNLMPQCIYRNEPEADGLLPRHIYDMARTDFRAASSVAVYQNAHDCGVDWVLHDADGDTMCVWGGDCSYMLANLSPWCPRGGWDGHVTKIVGGDTLRYDFGSTVGKTYAQWLCGVARDSLFLANALFRRAYDGIQIEDGADRGLACWAAHKPGGGLSAAPDPKGDGAGIPCDVDFRRATAPTFDSLLTHFVVPVRDAGWIVRANGHDLRWALDPDWWLGEDTLITHGFEGRKLESYGNWNGWPHDSTGDRWFDVYRGLETYYRPPGVPDERAGWDVSVVESRWYADDPPAERERWVRFGLGQTLMGDGFFAGQASAADEYFFWFMTGETKYAPLVIDEMRLPLGHAVGEYATFGGEGPGSLLYRQFRTPAEAGVPGQGCTVVVNLWERSVAGVPPRDAQWYRGLHSEFPQPESLLVFDHWHPPAPPPDDGNQDPVVVDPLRFGEAGFQLELEAPAQVQVTIHDVLGRRIRTLLEGRRPAGVYEVTWDGRTEDGAPVPAGVYFGRIVVGERAETRRLILIR